MPHAGLSPLCHTPLLSFLLPWQGTRPSWRPGRRLWSRLPVASGPTSSSSPPAMMRTGLTRWLVRAACLLASTICPTAGGCGLPATRPGPHACLYALNNSTKTCNQTLHATKPVPLVLRCGRLACHSLAAGSHHAATCTCAQPSSCVSCLELRVLCCRPAAPTRTLLWPRAMLPSPVQAGPGHQPWPRPPRPRPNRRPAVLLGHLPRAGGARQGAGRRPVRRAARLSAGGGVRPGGAGAERGQHPPG